MRVKECFFYERVISSQITTKSNKGISEPTGVVSRLENVLAIR